MAPRKLLTRVGSAAGLLGVAAAPSGIAAAAPAPPVAGPQPLPAGDPFASVAEPSPVELPAFAQGTVDAADGPRAGTRVDAYRTPGPDQAPIPFAYAFTDADGAFALRAAPGPLADGEPHTISLVISGPGSATTTDKLQISWDGARRTWARTSIDRPGGGGATARSTVGGGGLRYQLPAAAAGARAAAAAATSGNASNCRPVVSPGAVIPLEPADITTGALLVQPKVNPNGTQAEEVNWSITSDYSTARTTYVEKVDNVSLKADFSATFGSVRLGVSGERSLASTRGTATDVTVQNTTSTSTYVRSNRLVGLKWRAWAQLYECIDIPRTFAQGQTTYANAYLSLELAEPWQSNAVLGQSRSTLRRLDLDPATNKYVRPCGASRGNFTYSINPNGGFRRSVGTSQSFENGMTFKLGASVGGVQGSRTRSEKSRLVTDSRAWTEWKNNYDGTKYLCGYDANPSDQNNDPGFVVALGPSEQ